MLIKRLLTQLAPLAISGGLAAGMAAAAVAPAAHAVVLDTDRPKVTTSGFDFGLNWDTVGAPINGGHLDWDVTNGLVKPILTGNLYLKHVAGVCAWMHLEYRDANHNVLAVKDGVHHCADSNSKQQWSVTMAPFSSAYTTHVLVSIEHDNTNGSITKLGEYAWFLG